MVLRYDVYSHTADDHCRFSLGRSGSTKLLVIGLNPSTATQHRSDATLAKVESVAHDSGFDGFVMLNLCPIRATDFRALPRTTDVRRMRRNMSEIETVVARQSDPVVWAAWGASIHARDYFSAAAIELIARLKRYEPEWRHFGPLTAGGDPRHPSRLNYAWRFSKFDADGYVDRLRSPPT